MGTRQRGNGSPGGSQAGFNQVEILVGMVIFLIVAAIVAGYYRHNLMASRKSDAFYVSSQLAAAALEEAKGAISNPDTLAFLLGAMGDTTLTRKAKVARQGKEYTVAVRYRKVAAGSKLLRIKASVAWDGARGTSMGTVHPYEP